MTTYSRCLPRELVNFGIGCIATYDMTYIARSSIDSRNCFLSNDWDRLFFSFYFLIQAHTRWTDSTWQLEGPQSVGTYPVSRLMCHQVIISTFHSERLHYSDCSVSCSVEFTLAVFSEVIMGWCIFLLASWKLKAVCKRTTELNWNVEITLCVCFQLTIAIICLSRITITPRNYNFTWEEKSTCYPPNPTLSTNCTIEVISFVDYSPSHWKYRSG